MSDNHTDALILAEIRAGNDTREKLMKIDRLRCLTWALIGERLKLLSKRGTLIASKTGWRLAK